MRFFFIFCLLFLPPFGGKGVCAETPLAPKAQAFSAEDAQAIEAAQSYLRNLKTAKADFIQTAPTGLRMTGQFYLSRPGKLRFDYNEIDDFIVADGVFVYFYDSQLGEQSNAPIGQTLADFLLRKDLNFSKDLSVQTVYRINGYTSITLTQTENPQAGSVELVFSDIPYQLDRWQVTDPQGETTEIRLKNLVTGLTFDEGDLFSYHDPKGRKQTND